MRNCETRKTVVPSTLGEYRDEYARKAPFKERSAAVGFLDKKILLQGRDSEVIQEDSQVRLMLDQLAERLDG